jgi:hypothetical protein
MLGSGDNMAVTFEVTWATRKYVSTECFYLNFKLSYIDHIFKTLFHILSDVFMFSEFLLRYIFFESIILYRKLRNMLSLPFY